MSLNSDPFRTGRKRKTIFLGREFSQQKLMGSDTAIKIDQEIKR